MTLLRHLRLAALGLFTSLSVAACSVDRPTILLSLAMGPVVRGLDEPATSIAVSGSVACARSAGGSPSLLA